MLDFGCTQTSSVSTDLDCDLCSPTNPPALSSSSLNSPLTTLLSYQESCHQTNFCQFNLRLKTIEQDCCYQLRKTSSHLSTENLSDISNNSRFQQIYLWYLYCGFT